MTELRETLFRHLTLLQLIPRHPGRISTPVLLEKLRERGFQVDMRTLQRDLRDKLALHFPLACDDSRRPYRWYFDREFHRNLPAMDPSSALALVLAQDHLRGLLPPVVMAQLTPHFDGARRLLDEMKENRFHHWARRVRALPDGKTLIPAAVPEGIWQTVALGLLEARALDVIYLSRSRQMERPLVLHPQGLVDRQRVTYLIATANDHDDVRHFALHRIRSARISDTPWREVPDFDLDAYIAGGAFGYPQGPDQVRLVAEVTDQTAWLLSETPLSQRQRLEPLPDGAWHRLEAWVPDDRQTLWWLMGMGSRIHVLEPASWRETILGHARALLSRWEG
ncbi:helix-turn-helix transcriptional regulator [Ectothiorhodospira mobilis]|uniref:helix-turn-helix transcriptional regulator n=1 Tax=Ectothiorhodospira mobilis TaxID=195064 RepID=UPI0019082242|nr:WYL domain-containing protein [Ectothiorhodospira mobilis]MBK1690600.1 WYL domain-containing protein [Ectothiorhodospira mobilis]